MSKLKKGLATVPEENNQSVMNEVETGQAEPVQSERDSLLRTADNTITEGS